MEHQVMNIETVIDYIENNLDGKIDLETVANEIHYSNIICIACLPLR